MKKNVLGVIGGSGVYDIAGLKNTYWKKIESSLGSPSDELLFGDLGDQPMVFLPRHGRGHKISPSEINYRANIDALKRAGVTDVIAVSAVGSLKENLTPGMFVIVDQFIDRTFARKKSFFTDGIVAHISMANPVCGRLGKHLASTANHLDLNFVKGGTYLVMEGPQFSTIAESELYRSWNCDVIGMTNMPEAKLAREAEMCYASIAMVTDYDCWHPDHDHVTMDQIIKVVLANAENARTLVKTVAPLIFSDSHASKCACRFSLSNAIVTASEARNPRVLEAIKEVASRVIKANDPS